MRSSVFVKPLSQVRRGLLSVSFCLLVVSALWLGVYLDNSAIASTELSDAKAAQTFDRAIASQPNVLETLKDKVRNDLGAEADSAESVVEKSRQSFDNSAKQVEDTGLEVDGRTQENVAKIQGKVTDTDSGRGVENAIENVMNNIKDKVN